MNQNQSGTFKNNMSSHAALLLSASPTIVTSPLNNPQQQTSSSSASSPMTPSAGIYRQTSPIKTNHPAPNSDVAKRLAMARRSIPTTPLVSNLDQINQLGLPASLQGTSKLNINTNPAESYINFKKPQNEIFKKLDGKIQKIVAAHSNYNKLYALNDFSGVGAGPKRPFELPPQLPRPPPCIPKTSQQGHPGPIRQIRPVNRVPDGIAPPIIPSVKPAAPTSSAAPKPNKVDPAIMRLMAQKIREALANDAGPKNHQQSSSATSNAEKKKFQTDLINLLKKEISVVAKTANINFPSPPRPIPKPAEQKSLLRTSPQSLFNTIHRETSLLLKQRDTVRSSLSIIANPNQKQPQFTTLDRNILPLSTQQPQIQQVQKIPTTIKLVLPPTEFLHDDINKSANFASPRKTSNLKPPPSYQFIKNKLRSFQEKNHISLSKRPIIPFNPSSLARKKVGSQKTLDNIVDRLQAKSSPRSSLSLLSDKGICTGPSDSKSLNFQQRIVNTSAQLLRNARMNNTMTLAHTPIPVFRLPNTITNKNIYYNRSNALKALAVKSKKSKKFHKLGLALNSYLERDLQQPTLEKITIDDYARGLNLVRPNDISLQRHRERLLQSETRSKLPMTNRPIRLRRMKGERIHLPASASYRAASKAGLQ